MKKPFVALLCLIGAAAMLATSAFAQTEDLGIKLVNAKMAKELQTFDTVVTEFEVEPTQAKADLLALVTDLRAKGLLDVVPAPAS